MSEAKTTAEPTPAGAVWFRRVTFWSLLAGLCPLIPIPFVDDRALAWVRRRQVEEGLRAWELQAAPWQVEVLMGTDERRSFLSGCLVLTLVVPVTQLTVRLVKKVFRKIVVVLLIHDCARRFSETFHEGFLLHRALEQGLLDRRALAAPDGFALTQVRWVIRETCRAVDPRPIHQLARRIFATSRQLLREGARILSRLFRRRQPAGGAAPGQKAAAREATAMEEEERLLRGILDRLTAALWHEEGYRRHLEGVFDAMVERLATAEPAPPPTEEHEGT